MSRHIDVVNLSGDEYDRLMDEREILRQECERAWREVDRLRAERDDHARWRQDLADDFGECERIRDALGKAIQKRENALMAAHNAVAQMMIRQSIATGHGDTVADMIGKLEPAISALRKVSHAYETLRSEAEEWECDGLGLFAQHGWWEAVDEALDLLHSKDRPCTCHPDDNPPQPCPQKFAYSECATAAAHGNRRLVIVHPMLEPTHICKDCGVSWRQCDDFTFNLCGAKACPACDNTPVGGQLVSITAPLVREINRLRALSAPQAGCGQPRHYIASEPNQKLWLWKNGDHFLAYAHEYPCIEPGGDPLTLGQPVGYAIFKVSYDRQRNDHQSEGDRWSAQLQRSDLRRSEGDVARALRPTGLVAASADQACSPPLEAPFGASSPQTALAEVGALAAPAAPAQGGSDD